MSRSKLYLSFSVYKTAELAALSDRVQSAMTDNPAFPKPFVSLAELGKANAEFKEAMNAAAAGDRIAIKERNQKKEILVKLLRQLGLYVEAVAGDDEAKAASSGFDLAAPAAKPAPLAKPMIEALENTASQELAVRLRPLPGAKAYEVRTSYGGNGWQSAGIFTQARNIVVTNLTPGTTYTVQARAFGGENETTDWSDSVSRMSL